MNDIYSDIDVFCDLDIYKQIKFVNKKIKNILDADYARN